MLGHFSRPINRRSKISDTALYLNHAGTSWPKPQPVLETVAKATNSGPDQWPSLFRESFETVANFFHIDPTRLVLTPSCTSALNLAIMDHDWQAGHRIITSSFEHHALYRNLVKLRAQGIDVVEVPPASDNLFDLEQLKLELENGKTRLVAVTAACNVTGALLPVEQIIELAHQYGAKVLLDGAQVAGWMDLDLIQLGIDFFTFAGHKGPQAPWGIGGLYVAEKSKMNCPSATCEIKPGTQKTFDSKPGYCDAGSVDLIALAGLAAGCRWLSRAENSNRLANAREIAAEFTHSIREFSAAKIYHDLDIKLKMPTVAISFGEANELIAERLKENGVIASAGFQCAPLAHQQLGTSEHGIIRFSVGPSATNIDFDRVISALKL